MGHAGTDEPPAPSRVRLVDVARRAGVSMKTVSNVINDFAFVSEQTRARVRAVIEEMDYRPNLSARNLARGRTGLIALVVPQLDMPYFAALSRQVLDVAQEHGWVVLIHQTNGDLGAERAALSSQFGQRIDGMIVNPLAATSNDILDRRDPGPLVTIGEAVRPPATGEPGVDHVGIDNRAAATVAVEHLIATGRRRIAMVGPDPWTRNERYLGYRDALTRHGLAEQPELVVPTVSNQGDEAEAAFGSFLDSLAGPAPNAVFCATDWQALGVLRSLRLRSVSVPDDIAVVGFDDIPYGRAAVPTLSTISPDRRQIARLAVESLLDQQRSPGRPARDHLADFSLVVRESSAGRDGTAD